MTEQGAFRPTTDGKHVTRNEWSWSTVANMLYTESPAFVGFSYSKTAGDNVVGDKRTADDLVAFISGFYERHPQYANRDLFLSGESYGVSGRLSASQRVVAADCCKLPAHRTSLRNSSASPPCC